MIDEDLQRLVQTKRITQSLQALAPADRDDLRQLAALHVIERIARNPSFAATLSDPGIRRAYLMATLHNYARSLSRKSMRRMGLLRQASSFLTQPAESEAKEPLDLFEVCAMLLERTPPEGAARLAIDVIVENTTLAEYAELRGISLRTAQRHFLAGLQELRELGEGIT